MVVSAGLYPVRCWSKPYMSQSTFAEPLPAVDPVAAPAGGASRAATSVVQTAIATRRGDPLVIPFPLARSIATVCQYRLPWDPHLEGSHGVAPRTRLRSGSD